MKNFDGVLAQVAREGRNRAFDSRKKDIREGLFRRVNGSTGGAHPGAEKRRMLFRVMGRSAVLEHVPARSEGEHAGKHEIEESKKDGGDLEATFSLHYSSV